VLSEISDMILEQHQPRPPPRKIKPAEHLQLVAFHIDRQEIEPNWRARLDQNVVQRPHWYFDDAFGLRTRCHSVAIERRQRAGHMQPHAPAGILRGRAGHCKDFGGARSAEIAGKIRLRLDEDAGPAELLEMPGLRLLLWPICANLDKEAGPRASKKIAHEFLLAPIGQNRARSSASLQQL
jgi:hypothetical protein